MFRGCVAKMLEGDFRHGMADFKGALYPEPLVRSTDATSISNIKPVRILTLLSVAFMIAGCSTPVPQVLHPEELPASFSGPIPTSPNVWPKPDWWRGFGDEHLTDLISKAQSDNLDLSAAAARVMAAQAQSAIARSALFPQLGLQGQADRFTSNNGTTITTPSGNNNGTGTSNRTTSNAFELTLGASYEVDFWGLARSNLRAANEALKSARFAQQVVALTVTSNVADDYLSVMALRKRIAIANEDIAAINGILDTIKLKVSAGASSHLDLAQEQAQVEAVESQLPGLQEQEQESLIALALLLSVTPEKFDVKTVDLDTLRVPLVSPGLPSELLTRRPDVAAAEANLASAHANVDAARAAFLPQISLTADGGFASAAIGTLLHSSNLLWDIEGNLLQTIFDGGKLIGQKELAEATQKQLVAAYQTAVLNAYADVEISLKLVASTSAQEEHLSREVAAAREAFQIAQLQYRQGATDLLTVLQAQQTLFSAEDQLAQTTLARMQAVVRLYQALGGGWSEAPSDRTQVKYNGG